MIAAVAPRDVPRTARLVRVDPRSWAMRDLSARALPEQFRPGDLVVVNDAATMPASFFARAPGDVAIEVRLAGPIVGGSSWAAVLFGTGDWRARTEDRPAPPRLIEGSTLEFGDQLTARIAHVSALSPRLVRLDFDRDEAALWQELYRLGKPVQYSHLARELELWDAQTAFGGRPWSVETPSAARPLSWSVLAALRARGVDLASVTHAAGLSATGDPLLALRLHARSSPTRSSTMHWLLRAGWRHCGSGRVTSLASWMES